MGSDAQYDPMNPTPKLELAICACEVWGTELKLKALQVNTVTLTVSPKAETICASIVVRYCG